MMEAVKEKVELQRYPEYRDSGMDWLGEIPKDWELKRANYVFDIIDERSKTGKEELLSVSEHHGVKKRSESTVNMFMAESYKGYKLCYPGDLVINSLWAWSRGLGVSSLKGIVSTAYSVFRPDHEKYDQKFLHYLLRTRKYVAQYLIASKGIWISRLQLSDWAFLRIPILSPPKEEQTAIANFLDRKTEQIDQAIEIKQKQIELLKERRQILIHKTVTRGLKPDVPLKPSGVDWIGDIPEHWEVKKVKFLSRVKRGASPRPIDNPIYFDENGKYSWVRISDVSASEHYLETTVQRLSSLGASKSVKLQPGELFISIAGTVGQPIISKIKCCIHDGFVYFPDLTENVEYLYRIFESGRPYLGLGKHGTQLNLNTDTIGNIKIPIPTSNEKEDIVNYLNQETSRFDKNINLIKVQIERLKEYKTTLINSAVTGKIKVS